ncbi:MAG: anaerobic carbon-monoxide dehydrogenase catalytic subunit [Candidatus Omnitrophica bacterium]|nr:anaerobic carbon-monoxide dehydrogenase catalytic subunit [Candidatus Omnitrophota bacterium]MBU4345967.1 anaerobic carbon-monoxide dehydrogenase catalytic subunit [Candidatus Omnitrophota bacterium]MBU4472803.1 anaerobic carbon-monoxide dehydrogenase catalytic subunit [Candidatus Omnitrophota bacterium]MCG2705996.1 anaerobic carbon-monoxide dehydrogenase catalytic subunit [Candidatus Omnitrophota bacterium]
MSDSKQKSIDLATQEILKKAQAENIKTAWDRLESQEPQCGFGQLGLCCTVCDMGPCRIDPFGEGASVGVCGANADTIAARNLVRKVAVGASAHSDHGRDVAHTLSLLSEGHTHDYGISDIEKLKDLAQEFGIDINKTKEEITKALSKKLLEEFGRQEGELVFLKRAPKKRQAIWKKLNIAPRGIDREIVELLHTTTMGVDNDYKNLVNTGLRCALSDGWGGSMVATDLQDVILGAPVPIRGKVNLGVLKENYVNIVVHGHEPILSEMAVKASKDPELIKLAKGVGAEGINLAGICCTANEVLMRHGIPVAGNFLQQELAIITGAVEVMIVDVQCIMPALAEVATCFHTKLITTNPKARFPGVNHIEFKPENAYEVAKQIIKSGIENFTKRNKERVNIPKQEMDLVAGFTKEIIFQILGGKYRATYKPLNEAIISGRLRGLAGVVGCNNPKQTHDYFHTTLVKELIKNDVLVLQTGCSAIACAKHGLLIPEAAKEYAGRGLQEICEAVGIPPVLHLGSCVDNSRILTAASYIIKEGGLGEDLSDIPAAGCAPEWMSEKAITIGFYFVASGVYTVFGASPFATLGSKNLTDYLTKDLESIVGGRFEFCAEPMQMAKIMIEHIDKKRQALKLKPVMYQ